MLIPKTQESPRLFLKFHRETGDEVSDKQKDVTSYSVMLGMSEKGAFSPADSNVSSVDSDLYDPQLEQRNKPGGESDISSSNLLSKCNETSSVINSNMEFQNFERFDNLEPDSQGLDSSETPKQESSLKDKTSESEVKYSDKRDYIPSVEPSHSWTNDDKFHSQNSSNHRSVSSSVSHLVTGSTVNSVTSISSERTCTSNNFPNLSRNMSSNVVSSNLGSNSGDNGSESLVTTSGLKWDLRSASSPRVEDDGNLSCKSDSDRVASPGRLDKDSRNSPRSDKEKDSRSCSPKVPPLKIILPQKSSSSSSSDSESLKIHVSKAALPYVVNKGEVTPVTTVTAAATPVSSLLAQETIRPSSPASSRPSSRGSNTASTTKDSDKKQTEDNKISESSVKTSGDSAEQEKDIGKSKDDDKKEGTSQKSTRTLRSHTKEQQKLQEKPKEKESKEKETKEREKEKQGMNDGKNSLHISVDKFVFFPMYFGLFSYDEASCLICRMSKLIIKCIVHVHVELCTSKL